MFEAPDLSPVHPQKTLRWGWLVALVCIVGGLVLHHGAGDLHVLLWLHRTPLLTDSVWLFVTQWGDSAQALVFMLALFMHQPRQLSWVLKTWLMGVIASPVLKSLWDTARPLAVLDPTWLHAIGQPPMGNHAMPSGHALAAGSVAALLFFNCGSKRTWLALSAVLGAFMVGVSRAVVGAHWPGDVLVGWGLGWVLVGLALHWERVQPWARFMGSGMALWGVLALQAVLLWAVWLVPSEGPGMTWSRVLVSGLVAVAMMGAVSGKRWHAA